jgi:hypothetical protein
MSDEKQSQITMIHDHETQRDYEKMLAMIAAAREWPRGGWTMVRRHRVECRVCGHWFMAAAAWHCYCSDVCSNRASSVAQKRKRKARRAAAGAVCSCGATITPGPTGRLPRHCSAACRQREYRRRKSRKPE